MKGGQSRLYTCTSYQRKNLKDTFSDLYDLLIVMNLIQDLAQTPFIYITIYLLLRLNFQEGKTRQILASYSLQITFICICIFLATYFTNFELQKYVLLHILFWVISFIGDTDRNLYTPIHLSYSYSKM